MGSIQPLVARARTAAAVGFDVLEDLPNRLETSTPVNRSTALLGYQGADLVAERASIARGGATMYGEPTTSVDLDAFTRRTPRRCAQQVASETREAANLRVLALVRPRLNKNRGLQVLHKSESVVNSRMCVTRRNSIAYPEKLKHLALRLCRAGGEQGVVDSSFVA